MARRSPATRDTEALDARTRILVLHGTEQMLKREAFDRLHHALNEQFGDIDPVILDSKTATLADVLDELRTRSLLQPHNLVIVDQAEQFVSAHRQALERYAQSPVDHATLVLRCDRWSRGKLDKLIGQMGALVKCQPPDRRQAAEWLIRRASKIHHCRLAPAAADQMVLRLGTQLMRLDSELAKLVLMVDQKQVIGVDDLNDLIGRSNDEKAWVVQQALLEALEGGSLPPGTRRDGRDSNTARFAIQKIRELVELSGQPDVLVCFFVADLMRKLNMALVMRQQGAPDAQIGRHFRLWGTQLRAFMGLLQRLDPVSAGRLFDRIVELDRRAKSGFGTPLHNIECFCAVVADELR